MTDKPELQGVEEPKGALVGRMRKNLALRQMAIAKILGISRPALSAYEKGKGKLKPEIEERLYCLIAEKLTEAANSGKLTIPEEGSLIGANDCRRTRERLGITQKELADKVGLSQTSIAFFESGYSDLSEDRRRNLNAAFKQFYKEKHKDLGDGLGRLGALLHMAKPSDNAFDRRALVRQMGKLVGAIENLKRAYQDDNREILDELESAEQSLTGCLEAIAKSDPQASTRASDELLEYQRRYLPTLMDRIQELSKFAHSPFLAIKRLEKRIERLEKENDALRSVYPRALI